jgi:glycosyltransferase involved in cell wall biosynthesis
MRVSILIPVFQEEAQVGELLRRVLAFPVDSEGFDREILLCDDGSTDATATAIATAVRGATEVRVFSHRSNRGKGAAIRTLLEHVTGDCVLVQDADLEYEVSDAAPMLRAFAEGHDAVYGSRFLHTPWPASMRLANYVANRTLTRTANAIYGHRITDEATCLKLVRTSVLRSMRLECERFDFCPEVTAKLGRLGVPIHEVPVHYRARGRTEGKKITWRDGVEAMRALVKHRAWSAR